MASQWQKAASTIAKREGKKSNARIGNIREVLKVIVDHDAEAIATGGDFQISELLRSVSIDRGQKLIKKAQKK